LTFLVFPVFAFFSFFTALLFFRAITANQLVGYVDFGKQMMIATMQPAQFVSGLSTLEGA